MKSVFLVISDSHGNVPALSAALLWARGPEGPEAPAAALFLGDGAADLSPACGRTGFSLPWYRVRGNGDMNFSLPDTLILSAGPGGIRAAGTGESGGGGSLRGQTAGPPERRIFLVHGNRFAVETGLQGLGAAAGAAGAGIALFGHTHVPCLKYADTAGKPLPAGDPGAVLFLNPGSIGRPRSRLGATFAVLELPPDTAGPPRVRFWGLTETRRGYTVGELDL